MKELFFCLLSVTPLALSAQNKVTKYYDAKWMETSKEKAVFYADFTRDGANYNCLSYYANTNKVRGKSTYADTVMQLPIGLQVVYFKNGRVEDSSYYNNHEVKYSYHYYPNNQLEVHYSLEDNKKETTDAYDEEGKKIKNYIFMKEAEFTGGQNAWVKYISKNAGQGLTEKGVTDGQTAMVTIQFIVDESGYVVSPKIFKSSGFKNVDNDALQVIGNSPTWKNAIQYNNPVRAYRIQPITYILRPEKK